MFIALSGWISTAGPLCKKDNIKNCFLFRLEYSFWRYTGFKEYYSERYGHVWYTTITTPSGRRSKMRICKGNGWTEIFVGKEHLFNRMERRFLTLHRGQPDEFGIQLDDSWLEYPSGWWRMEQAVEPEETAKKKKWFSYFRK